MRKYLSLMLIMLILTGTFISGCGNKATDNTDSTKATEDILRPADSKGMLQEYTESFIEGDNPFYGVWQLEGVDYVSFMFRNDNLAEMIMGSEGSFTQLTIDEDKKTLDVSFFIALNGTYKYKFSNDKQTLVLTQNNSTSTLKKVENFDMIPNAPAKASIDDSITGWWKSENGITYYFGRDGIMYSNIIMSETYYTYEAKGGVINATYLYPEEVQNTMEYKVTKDGNLKIDGDIFKSYNPYEVD